MTESRFDIGMKVRKEVLGSDHVEQAQARTTEFDADFQRFITETAWGSIWARPDLDRRTRSLVTIAILAMFAVKTWVRRKDVMRAGHGSGRE